MPLLRAEDFEWRAPQLTTRPTRLHKLGETSVEEDDFPPNTLGITPELFESRLYSGKYAAINGHLCKRCARCKRYWTADTDGFAAHGDDKDGLSKRCLDCLNRER